VHENKLSIWLKAFRLRTLPLALANAVMGTFLAYAEGIFHWEIFILTALTITCLQILSNLANDYGDAVSGKDTHERIGPQRVTVSGLVTKSEMKKMIYAFVALSVIAGSLLIVLSLKNASWKQILLFFVMGLAAIVAAIKYTVGKNPYGYKVRGDIFVFLFFGLVGVMGTYFLQTHWFDVHVILPASIVGLFSVGVLNINNLRDVETDAGTGKETLAVKHGKSFAQKYHLLLLTAGWLLSLLYTALNLYSGWQWIFVLALPLFVRNGMRVFRYENPIELNPELKNLALATFLFSLLFGIGLIL
jgi:1,4-dihydroxy-2-naphthoate polyprenyltransferase